MVRCEAPKKCHSFKTNRFACSYNAICDIETPYAYYNL